MFRRSESLTLLILSTIPMSECAVTDVVRIHVVSRNRRARLLQLIPESSWNQMGWLEDEGV